MVLIPITALFIYLSICAYRITILVITITIIIYYCILTTKTRLNYVIHVSILNSIHYLIIMIFNVRKTNLQNFRLCIYILYKWVPTQFIVKK